MGTADISPVFGRTFNLIFPLLLLLLIVFNAFDVYSKVFKAVGLHKLEFDEDNPSQDSLEDGRKRLLKARADLETKILNSRSKNLADYSSYKMNVTNLLTLVFCYQSTQRFVAGRGKIKFYLILTNVYFLKILHSSS
jgi:hypothetical protein